MNSRNKEVEVKDLAIVGCGPAGLSAAVNAKATNTELQLFGSALCSPKMHKAPKVDNYLGFYEITGEELRKNFLEHVGHADIGVIKEKIDTIYSQKNYYTLVSRTELYHARAVILAVGTANPEYIEGEERYLGRGASYCATCDGPLYEDREVAVIAYTEEASREAEQLNEIASNVYYISQIDKDVSLPAEIQLIEDEPTKNLRSRRLHRNSLPACESSGARSGSRSFRSKGSSKLRKLKVQREDPERNQRWQRRQIRPRSVRCPS